MLNSEASIKKSKLSTKRKIFDWEKARSRNGTPCALNSTKMNPSLNTSFDGKALPTSLCELETRKNLKPLNIHRGLKTSSNARKKMLLSQG